LAVATFKTLYSPCGIDQLLFTGKKRMTGGADLGINLLTRGTGLEHVATQTLNGGIGIHRVDTFFHLFLLDIIGATETNATIHQLLILAI
jgi:hypothetical protein